MIERILRSTHILVTLKRDEPVREGRDEGAGGVRQVNSRVAGIASRKLGDDELCGRRTG